MLCVHRAHVALAGGEDTTYDDDRNQSIASIDFGSLETVAGYFELEYMGPITAVSFPALVSVGKLFDINYNTHLETFVAKKLATVGWLEVDNNPALKEFSLPAFEATTGVDISDNNALESISFPRLISTKGDFYCYDNDKLASISCPVLATIGDDLYLGGEDATGDATRNQSLATLDFASLATVAGDVELEYMGPITEVAFPELAFVGGYLDIDYNTHLETFSAPKLTSIDELEVNDNDRLEKVYLPSLVTVTSNIAMTLNNAKLTKVRTRSRQHHYT